VLAPAVDVKSGRPRWRSSHVGIEETHQLIVKDSTLSHQPQQSPWHGGGGADPGCQAVPVRRNRCLLRILTQHVARLYSSRCYLQLKTMKWHLCVSRNNFYPAAALKTRQVSGLGSSLTTKRGSVEPKA
jgi:hypothetical protein